MNKITTTVCRIMHIDPAALWQSNRAECVNARAVICTIMSEHGMSDREIAHLFGKTRQCINKLRNSFTYRLYEWSVRMAYGNARRQLADI